VHRLIWVVALSAALAVLAGSASAATLEPVGQFEKPIFITSDPENGERLLVVEREGTVQEVGPGAPAELADLSSLVSCCESERGLLSIAPAADFNASGRFYAAYTGTTAAGGAEGDIHIDSFRRGASAAAPIREPIIGIGHASNANHNGGQLQFGPDGDLYISLGDGGGAGDPQGSGQDTEVLLGKVLRIDPRPGQVPAYSIPADNPFVGGSGRDEIWSYGLRNPWRFSFDRASGDMVIADVGQGAREEVDFATSQAAGAVGGAGFNYGWSCREGFIAYPDPDPACASASGFTDPVFDYPHQDPGDGSASGCSIIGGYVVRDPALGDLFGRYVYSDFCSQEIRSLALPAAAGSRVDDDRSEGISVTRPTSFGEDACGRLYVAAGDGTVYRLVGTTPSACAQQPEGEPPVAAPTAPATSPSTLEGQPGSRQVPPRPRLRLHSHPAGQRLKIVAELSPCAGHAGQRLQLNRGGEPLASKRLNRGCIARFLVRVRAAATFRALLLGDEPIRSSRLAVEPAGRNGG
jgi:hypothetical protein